MSKESKCFYLNKKHYKKWKKFITNVTDKPKEKETEKKVKGENTFEDYFPVDTVTKFSVNRIDYQPFLERV